MANVRITRPIGRNSPLLRDVHAVVAEETAARLQEVARQADIEFDQIVRDEFIVDRPPDRRRTGRHLLGSSNTRVEWNGTSFPIRLSMGSTAEGKKLGALEFGSPPHVIEGNPLLVFPVAQRFAGRVVRPTSPDRITRSKAARTRNKAGQATVATQRVNHPGTKAHHMRERALERAVRKVYANYRGR